MTASVIALTLVIRIYDVFGLPGHDLSVARRVSENILARAGIELTWIACESGPRSPAPAPKSCNEPPRANELLMHIVSTPRQRREDDALGFAYVDTAARVGSLATLYADRIAMMAAASGVNTGTLLGRALAHEAGHLLLGTTSHQPRGLMRARWTAALVHRRVASDWIFSPTDAEGVSEGLRKRVATATETLN